MSLVSILLPVELIVTTYYWGMYIFDKDAITSEEMKQIGYVEFDHTINVSVHLVPFIALSLDFVAELDFFEYKPWQGIAIVSFCISYIIWLLFLFSKNKVPIF